MDESNAHILTTTAREPKKLQLWKQADQKATKSGPHHSIYWVRQAPVDKKAPAEKNATKDYVVGAKYTGDWENNKKNGFGTQTWMKGHKYEGEWCDNKRQGKGTFWVNRKGKLIKQYTGEWHDDTRTGTGVFYYNDGSKYEGQWQSNRRQGRGKMIYADDSMYEGDWYDDVRSGLGVMCFPDGNRYEGHWLNDKKEGPGRYFYFNTNKIYEGEWQNDIGKCGVFHDLSEDADASNPDNFSLPTIGVEDPAGIISSAITAIRQDRSRCLDLANRASTEEDNRNPVEQFSDEELSKMQEQFDNFDHETKGLIRCGDIVEIMDAVFGSFPNENEIFELLSQLQASYDTRITFPELLDITLLLRTDRNGN